MSMCTARLFEIRPSNEVRIKLNENSELDKNGYRYVLTNNAICGSSQHKPINRNGFCFFFINFFLSKRKKFIKYYLSIFHKKIRRILRYVLIFYKPRYSACSSVSTSSARPMLASLTFATSLSISTGTA